MEFDSIHFQQNILGASYFKYKEEAFQTKMKLISLQLENEKLKTYQSELLHIISGYRRDQSNHKVISSIRQNELDRTQSYMIRNEKKQISLLKDRNFQLQKSIEKLLVEKKETLLKSKAIEQKYGILCKEKEALVQKNQSQKGNFKIMFGKIHELQKQNKFLQEKLQEKQKKYIQSNVLRQQPVNLREQITIENQKVLQSVSETLRQQVISDLFQIFLNSAEKSTSKPSITVYGQNLKLFDKQRMKSYCDCYSKCLKQILPEQFLNLSQKQKWLLDFNESLQKIKQSTPKNNNKLPYLFRIANLYHRIKYSIQGYHPINTKIVQYVQNEFFKANYEYLYS